MVALCLMLLIASRAEVGLVEKLRMSASDLVSPIHDALSRPVDALDDLATEARTLLDLRTENAALREEVARLRQWYDAAQRLDTENRALRDMLNYAPPPNGRQISARIIADAGGAYVRNVLVSVGAQHGAAKGQAAVTGEGMVGRVTEVGHNTARVLLITDLNSKIPVTLENSRERAVLAGDNSATPKLLYIRQEASIQVGDRVVTSGHGGMLPPGLPIGVVSQVSEKGVSVRPYADWQRLEHVRLLDYGLNGPIDPKASLEFKATGPQP
jgi:rod shape-determining protein MreC